MLLELCFAAYSGLADKQLADVIKEGSLASMEKLKEDTGGFVGEAMRELRAALQTHRRIIAVDARATPPPPGTRTLKRYDSETMEEGAGRKEEIAQERNDVWKNAQSMRKKTAQIGVWTAGGAGATMASLQKIYQKCALVKAFKGKLKEAHRAFIFTADLLAASASKPWQVLSDAPLETPYAKAIIEFMLDQQGPFDILIFCDGRSRKARRVIEDALESRRHVVEAWLIFTGASKIYRSRNVTFASDTREVIMIALPCPRTQLTVKERAAYNACGEATTHYGTYTGVQAVTLRNMPKVSAQDKCAILGLPTGLASPPPRLVDSLNGAVPIFWQERKPHAFWRQLLIDLDIKAVCDLTPGSGILAKACMQEGCSYFGITRSAAHGSYMQNKLDRDALGIISMNGSALYEADMAEHIKEHFADIVDELHAADADDADTDDGQDQDDDDDNEQ